jgi:hypothetical protein
MHDGTLDCLDPLHNPNLLFALDFGVSSRTNYTIF